MTKPTTLADTFWSSETLVPRNNNGGDKAFDVTYTVPASTAAATIIGMVRVHKGAKLILDFARNEDLDTSTNVTYSVGIAYDDNTDDTDDADLFISAQSGQAAFKIDRTAASFQPTAENFVVPSDGYITLTIVAGPTTTEGDIFLSGIISRTRGYAS